MRFELNINMNNDAFKHGKGKVQLCNLLDQVSESLHIHNTDDLRPETNAIKCPVDSTIYGYYSIKEEPLDKAKIKGERFYVQQVEDDPEYFHLMDRINGEVVDVGNESDMNDQAKELNEELDEAWQQNKTACKSL